MDDSERGTGRTKAQMLNAPRGAIFVWVNHHLDYPRALARSIGRDDLEFVSPERLEYSCFDGRELSAVILDHAAHLTSRQWNGLHRARERIRSDGQL
jgi:hypothetical protein